MQQIGFLSQNLLFAQHVEQTVSFAIKNQSFASSWPFISTYSEVILK